MLHKFIYRKMEEVSTYLRSSPWEWSDLEICMVSFPEGKSQILGVIVRTFSFTDSDFDS